MIIDEFIGGGLFHLVLDCQYSVKSTGFLFVIC